MARLDDALGLDAAGAAGREVRADRPARGPEDARRVGRPAGHARVGRPVWFGGRGVVRVGHRGPAARAHVLGEDHARGAGVPGGADPGRGGRVLGAGVRARRADGGSAAGRVPVSTRRHKVEAGNTHVRAAEGGDILSARMFLFLAPTLVTPRSSSSPVPFGAAPSQQTHASQRKCNLWRSLQPRSVAIRVARLRRRKRRRLRRRGQQERPNRA